MIENTLRSLNGLGLGLACLAAACAPATHGPVTPAAAHQYLYLWTAPLDSTASDFLAVLDVTEQGDTARYGSLVTTLPVPAGPHMTHHTEAEMPADRQLFANDFMSGRSSIFDLTDPAHPRLAAQFGDAGKLSHPHSFVRLANGNVLATFQTQQDSLGTAPGGLVEMTPKGEVVRSGSADVPGVDRRDRPYSPLVLPWLGRVIVTTTDMVGDDTTTTLQFWRLSDLSLERTLQLPPGPRGNEGYLTAEPRVLSDGKTVLVSTFNCGLYLLSGLDTKTPSAKLVASFPKRPGTHCAVPVVAGNYYLITVAALSAVLVLDVSDPERPFEVSRMTLGPDDQPHWIAISPDHRRVVVTGYKGMRTRVVLADFDERTGKLTLDRRFRAPGSEEPGFRFEGITWPQGGSFSAVPHGAVFSR